MKKSVAAIAVVTLAGSFALAADTHSLSGTFTNSKVEDGVKAYLKLVEAGDDCTAPGMGVAATMASPFADGKAKYVIDAIAAGAYTACAFIDANEKEGEVTADSGDYGAVMNVSISADTTLDIDEASWMEIP
jgi:hypothetical protein